MEMCLFLDSFIFNQKCSFVNFRMLSLHKTYLSIWIHRYSFMKTVRTWYEMVETKAENEIVTQWEETGRKNPNVFSFRNSTDRQHMVSFTQQHLHRIPVSFSIRWARELDCHSRLNLSRKKSFRTIKDNSFLKSF